ncbi:C2H2 finger domain protein [Aspergillus rambellii]|uniref:C2H2 finger domain protein n=1 Tax=Aspergillus rambellii TaxID=308745 RepID=A0A0F8X5T7_9EURO|nr:C2H2 finger domain protein [Aspergillus rambellii]
MTMVLENQNRQYGGMGFDHVYPHSVPHTQPHFTDPWTAAHTTSHSTPSVYATSMGSSQIGLAHIKEEAARPSTIPMPYSSIPVSAPSMVAASNYSTTTSTSYPPPEMMGLSHDIPRTTFEQAPAYTTAPAMSTFAPANYAPLSYAPTVHQDNRRIPHADAARVGQSQAPPGPTFGDALDASRGMVALSQDLTPRNVYAPRASRGSGDSYGFPLAHSSGSSISSGGSYPYYSASVASVESSVTDYSSTTSESYDNGHLSRTLPRPSNLLTGSAPPGPQSMMSQFSSKMPSNTQKKHKCKVCDKRFTRPSSLQTHMYSHTGEKPFACDVEGCGRHFSVVSNLRRHKKVHKGDKEGVSGEDEE